MSEKLLDHAVPAELVELHEIIDWEAALAKVGMPGNTAPPSPLVTSPRAVIASITAPIVGRAQAGLRPPLSTSGNITPGGPNGGNTDHYGGDPLNGFPWDHGRCASIWRAYQAYHIDHNGWVDIAYCVDEDTEILTQSGWRRYTDVHEGDMVWTLNHETGLAEWQPVLEMCVFPRKMREMIAMEGYSHSSLSTPNHRWPVERYLRRTNTPRHRDEQGRWSVNPDADRVVTPEWDRTWSTSETFRSWDRIPITAPNHDAPDEPKYSDALVELVAWFWTEGHIVSSRGRSSTAVVIYQSHVVNEHNCARIRLALTRTFGPAVDSFPRTGPTVDGVARWREARNGRKTEFYLNTTAGKMLLSHAPGRVVDLDFIRSLTSSQLELFIETSIDADGSRSGNGVSLAQKSREAAESFGYACILSGKAVTYYRREPTSTTSTPMYGVSVRRAKRLIPRRGPSANTNRWSSTRVVHDGIVWCPRTPNQTWYARRNGTCYFTGNTGGICIHGYIFVGRWFGVRTAANGNNTGNQDTYAWCYMAGKGQPLTDAAKVAYLDAHALAISADAGPNVWPHHHWFQTDCPGSDVDAWLNAGLPRPGGVPPVPPTQPVDPHAKINAPVTGMAHTPSGRGYVLVAADGGVFCFGDAAYHGSLPQIGVRPNQPIVGVSITPSGGGYWLVSADGGVYAFGDAGFFGSAGGMHINAPVCGIASTPTGAGYYLPSTDGGIFSYGDAAFYGSAA